MDFVARTATLADAPAILEMMADFNAHEAIRFDREIFAPRLAALVADPALGGVLLFTVDDATAGYAIVTYGYDLEYGGRDAFLTELWIVESARGLGAGKLALAAAEAYARERGAHALHLLVRHDNRAARALYDRSGYTAEPRVVMTKPLD
jgi:ribosomal protein S18 acetylase RimI-like enzyme